MSQGVSIRASTDATGTSESWPEFCSCVIVLICLKVVSTRSTGSTSKMAIICSFHRECDDKPWGFMGYIHYFQTKPQQIAVNSDEFWPSEQLRCGPWWAMSRHEKSETECIPLSCASEIQDQTPKWSEIKHQISCPHLQAVFNPCWGWYDLT